MTKKAEQWTGRVRKVSTGEKWPNLGDLRALVEACEGMSDKASITVVGLTRSATYVDEWAITGRLIVRETTTEKE